MSPFWLLTRPIWGSGLQTFQAPSTLSKPLVPGSEAVYCRMVKSFAAKYEYLNLSWQFWLTHHNSRVWPSPHWIISRYTPLSVQHVPLVLWLLFHCLFSTLHLWSKQCVVTSSLWLDTILIQTWMWKMDANGIISKTGSLKEKGRPHHRLAASRVAASLFCLVISLFGTIYARTIETYWTN